MITILLYEVNKEPEVKEIDIETMQEIVGGYVEGITIAQGLFLMCNEDAHLMQLPYNRFDLLGDFFFTRADNNGEPITLSEEDINKLKAFRGNLKELVHYMRN